MSMSPPLLCVLLLSLFLFSVRAQPPAPEGMPMLPGMGSSDDDDMYTVYQMDPSTSSMLAYESYDTFDVMAVDEYGVGQLVSLGAKKGTFRMPHPLAMVEAAPKYETLPTETLKTRYLKPITKTTYIDQDIIQPKTIIQPVLQQRLVEQPIIRTRLVKQPIRRTIINKSYIRPHLITQTQIIPELHSQDVIQPKVIEQKTTREAFNQDYQTEAPITNKATVKGKAPQEMYSTALPTYQGY